MNEIQHVETLIIGAGISGLGAGKILRKEGCDVLLLEARERHGGRINTIKWHDNDKEYHADLGANYLHGCAPYQEVQPLFNLASKINIKTAIAPGDILGPLRGWECLETAIWREFGTGDEISIDEVTEISYLMDRCLIRILRNQKEKNRKIPLSISLEKALKLNVKVLSKAKMLPKSLSQKQYNMLKSFFARYLSYVNPLERMSSFLNLGPHFKASADSNYADDVKRPTVEEKTEHMQWLVNKRNHFLKNGPEISVAKRVNHNWEDRLVLSGFSQFTDYLATDLSITYGRIVKVIDYSDPEIIKVQTVEKSGKSVWYTCKYCVISLPVGVLKGLHEESRVEFIPKLSKKKMNAINALGIPSVGAKTHDKIVLVFKEEDVFWDVDYPNIESDDPRVHILNLHYYGQAGVLMGHIWAGSNFELFGKTDEQVVDEYLELLSQIYPKTRPMPTPKRFYVTRWSEDPFSLGSYTEGEIGSGDRERLLYSESVPNEKDPRLLFCGEGTLDSKGSQQCTHGAFLTGIDRALKILKKKRGTEVKLSLSRIIDYITCPSIDSLFSTHKMSRRRSAGNTDVVLESLPPKRNRRRHKKRSPSNDSFTSSMNTSSCLDTSGFSFNDSFDKLRGVHLSNTGRRPFGPQRPHVYAESEPDCREEMKNRLIHQPIRIRSKSQPHRNNERDTALILPKSPASTIAMNGNGDSSASPLKIVIHPHTAPRDNYPCPKSWPRSPVKSLASQAVKRYPSFIDNDMYRRK